MKNEIILTSIRLLDNLGVKFTIDDLKNELKISKKTIYKYFENKEDLAQTVFNYVIDSAITKQSEILAGNGSDGDKMILCLLEYMEIYRLQSEKIFNLYSLNTKLQEGVKQKGDANWSIVLENYHSFMEQNKIAKISDDSLRIIMEGILKKISFEPNRRTIGYECIKAVIEKC